jgi:hypothetical protein
MNAAVGARSAAMLVSLALLAGCETPHQGAFDPSLFAGAAASPQTAEAPLPGRMRVQLAPGQDGRVLECGPLRRSGAPPVRLPLPQITERALQQALDQTLTQRGAPLTAPAPTAGTPLPPADATLTIDQLQFSCSDRYLWVLPAPPPVLMISKSEITIEVAYELTLRDAAGRSIWTQHQGSGRLVLQGRTGQRESHAAGIVRLAHEAAWRLAQQSARDVRHWWQAERMKPRQL